MEEHANVICALCENPIHREQASMIEVVLPDGNTADVWACDECYENHNP
jgi:hypothetical protein